jgi:hypothetical protein
MGIVCVTVWPRMALGLELMRGVSNFADPGPLHKAPRPVPDSDTKE